MENIAIEKLVNDFKEELTKITTVSQVESLKILFLGKKSEIEALSKQIKNIDPSMRKEYGQMINQTKNYFKDEIEQKYTLLAKEAKKLKHASEKVNLNLESKRIKKGSQNLLVKTTREIENIFSQMGYEIVLGNEIETDYYNFQALNIPQDHPARDMQDTFYINENLLLRTHTSGMQVRQMEKLGELKDLKMISHGKVYRRDEDDATHSHQFMQIEGLWIGQDVSFANFKTDLTYALSKYFSTDVKLKMRPSHFPFTEPSVEVDMQCYNCQGKGCNICKNSGLIEILGAGMVNDHVLENSGIDSKKYSGFAFGIGIERITMLKYKISDIREFYNNNLKFIQFGKENYDN